MKSTEKRAILGKSNMAGITLIALVVTIVILIILATIAVRVVLGEGGLIDVVGQAEDLQNLENEKERLEMVKSAVAIENRGRVTVTAFVEELLKEKIIIEEEITNNPDGSKTVITDNGYSVNITKKGEKDIDIDVEGKKGALLPRISDISLEIEGTSIKVHVEAKRAEGAIYIISYKTDTGVYIEAYRGEKSDYTITGLDENETYTVNVVVKNDNGQDEKAVTAVEEDSLAVEPKVSQGMIPVMWDGTNWVKAKDGDLWYNYTRSQKRWANVVLGEATFNNINGKEVLDESKAYTQLVWIPRYAYKITSMYHMNGDANTAGNIEVVFINNQNKDKNGNTYSETYPTYTEGTNGAMSNYVVHPAFNYGTNKLDGIWVGKYETSNIAGSIGYSGNEVMQIKANVTSWREIKVSDIYTASINMNKVGNVYGISSNDSVVDPHMLKNSEWGAVAYLSKSKYGKETEEVYINNNSNYITGIAGDTATASSSASTTNTYNTGKGMKASTTGNIYGVYDMSGGAYEYVAGYVANGNGSLTSYGDKLVNGPDKHKDVYKNNGDTRAGNYSVANAANGKYGDAAYETSNSGESSNNSWYSDYSYFPYSSYPFFHRGGGCSNASSAGVFYFNNNNGSGSSYYSFRVAVPVL